MIGWLILRTGLPKWLVIGLLVALTVGVLGLGKCAYDRSLVKAHDDAQAVEVLGADRNATQAADRAGDAREAQHAAEAANTQEALRNAKQARPEDTARSSGPAVSAVTDSLRQRER